MLQFEPKKRKGQTCYERHEIDCMGISSFDGFSRFPGDVPQSLDNEAGRSC